MIQPSSLDLTGTYDYYRLIFEEFLIKDRPTVFRFERENETTSNYIFQAMLTDSLKVFINVLQIVVLIR